MAESWRERHANNSKRDACSGAHRSGTHGYSRDRNGEPVDARAPPYAGLTPDCVLDALDSVGIRGDGRLLALNSYENRVYQVWRDDEPPVVAKFYRPARWTDDAILEEHALVDELAARGDSRGRADGDRRSHAARVRRTSALPSLRATAAARPSSSSATCSSSSAATSPASTRSARRAHSSIAPR